MVVVRDSLDIIRRTCVVLLFAVAAALGAGCDEGEGILEPDVAGQITGTVTVDAAGALGVVVTLSNGQVATTNASGQFTFSSVPAGAYTVTISGFPADVAFPSTTQAAVVATSGQVVTVNFAGSRIRTPGPVTHTGTLSFAGGDASHNQFVFNATQGKSASLTLEQVLAGTTYVLRPQSGFSPSTLPVLTGTIASGAVSLSGSGTIAGVNDVSVTAAGTLVNGKLDITITVGADGKLPGGQSIQYRYVDN